jgi:hypothetical protein
MRTSPAVWAPGDILAVLSLLAIFFGPALRRSVRTPLWRVIGVAAALAWALCWIWPQAVGAPTADDGFFTAVDLAAYPLTVVLALAVARMSRSRAAREAGEVDPVVLMVTLTGLIGTLLVLTAANLPADTPTLWRSSRFSRSTCWFWP